jgi:hypothetical protein
VKAEQDRIGEALLAERAIIFKYIKGVSQISIPEKFEVTPDQEKYFKRFDEWAIEAGNYPAVKALDDLMKKIYSSKDRLRQMVQKDVTEVHKFFENEESKSLSK